MFLLNCSYIHAFNIIFDIQEERRLNKLKERKNQSLTEVQCVILMKIALLFWHILLNVLLDKSEQKAAVTLIPRTSN
jgi:hypothetical protein